MAKTLTEKEKRFWYEFLDMYRDLPALWRIKSDEYSNRIIKNQGYEKLVEKLKEICPDANREMVVKKINTFRTTYRKELKKVRNSEKSGSGAADIYEPTLWYYYTLSFLEDQEDSAASRSTMDTEEEISPTPTPPRSKKKKCLGTTT